MQKYVASKLKLYLTKKSRGGVYITLSSRKYCPLIQSKTDVFDGLFIFEMHGFVEGLDAKFGARKFACIDVVVVVFKDKFFGFYDF